MEQLFSHITMWHWIALGALFVIAEIFVSGFVLLWFGIASIIVGVLVGVFSGMGWELQLSIFAITSVASIVAWFKFVGNRSPESDRPELNNKSAQYLNRIFSLEEPIINGIGKVKVGDSLWRVSGEDAPVGSTVKVIGMESTTFRVTLIKRAE